MLLASVGQGTPYTAPRLLFPFAMFGTCFPNPHCGGFMLGALLRFPIYGLILGRLRFPGDSGYWLSPWLCCMFSPRPFFRPMHLHLELHINDLTNRWSQPLAGVLKS
jgi:hypothetical protein